MMYERLILIYTKFGDILLGIEDVYLNKDVVRVKKCIRLYIGDDEIKVIEVLPMLNKVCDIYVNMNDVVFYSYDIKKEYIDIYSEIVK